jgi:hypothetical protein
MQSIREAVVRADFFSLPTELSPEKVFLHMPDLRVEVELASRTQKVSLYSPDELEGDDKQRFMDVWNALLEPLPFKPSW